MTAPNSREAQIGRLIDAVQARGLTVHAVETDGKRLRVLTSPVAAGLPAPQPAEDAADRWLRERRARKAGGAEPGGGDALDR